MRIKREENGSQQLTKDIILSILPFNYKNMSMIDIGCRNAPITKTLNFKDKTFVDIIEPDDIQHPFYLLDAYDYLLYNSRHYDVLFAIDFIEHLDKVKGNALLDLVEVTINKLILFFTPTGYFALSNPGKEEFSPHKHWSGWEPNEFLDRGYDVIEFPNFHNPWTDGNKYGAFFAYKIKET